jgi:hypothetical protein
MKKPGEIIDDEFSRKVAELIRMIERLPPERQDQLRRELEDGTLDAAEVLKELEDPKE